MKEATKASVAAPPDPFGSGAAIETAMATDERDGAAKEDRFQEAVQNVPHADELLCPCQIEMRLDVVHAQANDRPPAIPMQSATIVKSGIKRTQARKRGTTR